MCAFVTAESNQSLSNCGRSLFGAVRRVRCAPVPNSVATVIRKSATVDPLRSATPANCHHNGNSKSRTTLTRSPMLVHRIESGLQHVTKPATVDLNGEVPTSCLPNPGLQLGHPFIHFCVPFLCIGISATSHAQGSNRMLEVESGSACSSRLWLPTQTQAELYDTAHKVHLCRWGGGCKTE